MAKRQPGSTFKKNGKLYRVSSSGKPFVSSNSKKAQQQRALNARLDQPVAAFQGPQGVIASPTTERDLAHQAATATKIQYGPSEAALAQQLQQAVQSQANTNNYYEDYKKRLQGYQQQVAGYQQGFREAMANLPGAVQGLGQQAYGQVQQQQAAMPQGTANVPGDVAQNASNANAIGQAAAANWAAYANATANANNQYAGNLANVVAPGQQLVALNQKQGAINQVKQKQTDLAGQEGAYNQNYRTTQRQNEQKNLLAQATLGVNQSKVDLARDIADTNAKNNSPTGKGATAQATNDARVAANHGYSLHDWRMLGPTKRAAIIAKDKKSKAGGSSGDKVYTSGPFAGKTQAEIQAMTPAQRDALINKANKKPGSKNGPKLTAEQLNTGISQLPNLKEYLSRAKTGKPFVEGHNPQTKLGRAGAVKKVRASTKKLVSDALLGAAADAVYNGIMSRVTAQRLRDAGFDPARVARELGIGINGGNIPASKI